MEIEDISVARLMTSDLITVTADTPVEAAANTLLEEGIGSLVVVDEDTQLEGIVTGTDFIEIVSNSSPKAETTIGEYMTEDVVTVGAQDSLREAADRMIEHDIQHLPVDDPAEGVIGMLSATDLTIYLSGTETPSP